MELIIKIPDDEIPKKQEIALIGLHFIDGKVCECTYPFEELKELKQNNTTKPVITKSDIEKANKIFNDKDFWNINDKAKKLLKNINTSECEYNYDCEHCGYWELTRVCKKCNNREQTNTAEWIFIQGYGTNHKSHYKCSNCDYKIGQFDIIFDYNFCPRCGARMKGENQ